MLRSEESSFVLGANFPWVDCGWDFGPPPPGWKRDPEDRFARVETDLRELRALGIKVVRFWVLAGGVNYPVGQRIEEICTNVTSLLGRTVAYRLRDGAKLPVLPEGFLRDFASLCEACLRAGVQLLPSLLSFEWFDHAQGPSRGRAPLVFSGGGDDAQVARFLDVTLSPLLEVSRSYRATIYAWEVLNEPDWVVQGGPFHPCVKKTVTARDMNAFLRAALKRVVDAGFTATIGFKAAAPRWLAPDLRMTLEAAQQQGAYLHQLHHYPNLIGERRLMAADASPIGNVFVGEFPTSDIKTITNARWLDQGLAEDDPDHYLERRLSLILAQGYRGAFLWATEPAWIKERRLARGGPYEGDSRVRWTCRQRAQVRRFAESLAREKEPLLVAAR